ncbi:MAG: hypothetical protein V9H26_10795 [Verrucomicrobiota bacterium]
MFGRSLVALALGGLATFRRGAPDAGLNRQRLHCYRPRRGRQTDENQSAVHILRPRHPLGGSPAVMTAAGDIVAFGCGANSFNTEFVPIGNPGNGDDLGLLGGRESAPDVAGGDGHSSYSSHEGQKLFDCTRVESRAVAHHGPTPKGGSPPEESSGDAPCCRGRTPGPC